MDQQTFDNKFRELFTNMVEIAFEFVDDNKEEVDGIYIFGSMEANVFVYNVCYNINGKVRRTHLINNVSKKQYDVSSKRTFAMLNLGADYLMKTAALFEEAGRPVPTLMKMFYNPKTGAFDNKISYDLYYSNDAVKTASQVFQEWYKELGGE